PGRQGYTPRPRACGGIGRRARLRALWTDWSVEVRVLSGALGKPRYMRGFLLLGSSRSARLSGSFGNIWQQLWEGSSTVARREYPGVYPYPLGTAGRSTERFSATARDA